MSLYPMVSSLRSRMLAYRDALDKEIWILKFDIGELDKVIEREGARIADEVPPGSEVKNE